MSVLPAALALLAVLVRRADLLVLLAPLALAAVPLVRRPTGRPRATLEVAQGWVPEGEPAPATVAVADADGAQTAALQLATPDWVRPEPGTAASGVVRPAGAGLAVILRLTAQRWGWSTVGPGTVVLSACGGLLRAGPATVPRPGCAWCRCRRGTPAPSCCPGPAAPWAPTAPSGSARDRAGRHPPVRRR